MRLRIEGQVAAGDQLTLSLDGKTVLRVDWHGTSCPPWLCVTPTHVEADLENPGVQRLMLACCRMAHARLGDAFLTMRHQAELSSSTGATAQIDLSTTELLDLLDASPAPNGAIVDGYPASDQTEAADTTKVVAFYLPQFHPFAENDAWWGMGFTEWTNVVAGAPQYVGHSQPLLPADLGFYDLRLEDVRMRQAALARAYGIDAFCYYYYWFSGRRIMPEVVDKVVSTGVPDMPFFYCWANETWSRRWDGSEREVLIHQEHDLQTDLRLMDDLIPVFRDERYIKVDGKPVLLIYRPQLLPDAAALLDDWRQQCRREGFAGLYVVAVRSFGLGVEDAAAFDAMVEFPPHGVSVASAKGKYAPEFGGEVYDYEDVVVQALGNSDAGLDPGQEVPLPIFPGVMPRWDNTARARGRAHIYANASPEAFKFWMQGALERARRLPVGRQFVFINAWNEWAEGAVIEPDRRTGRAYLEAIRRARSGYEISPTDVSRYMLVSGQGANASVDALRTIATETRLATRVFARAAASPPAAVSQGQPEFIDLSNVILSSPRCSIDWCSTDFVSQKIRPGASRVVAIRGWIVFDDRADHQLERVAFLLFTNVQTKAVFNVPIREWSSRPDVAAYLKVGDMAADRFGFYCRFDAKEMPPGSFRLSFCQNIGHDTVLVRSPYVLEL